MLASIEAERRAQDTRPIPLWACLACAISGVVVSMIIAVVMHSKGRRQAMQDALVWSVMGLGVKLLLGLVLAAL